MHEKDSTFMNQSADHDLVHPRIRARISDKPPQTFGVVVTYRVLKMDALTALSDEELVAHIAPTLQRYLAGPL